MRQLLWPACLDKNHNPLARLLATLHAVALVWATLAIVAIAPLGYAWATLVFVGIGPAIATRAIIYVIAAN